jgi:hypothetical protein
MTIHVFTLVTDRSPTDHEFDILAESGKDDLIFGIEDGLTVAEFDREAGSLAAAVATAVLDLESIGVKTLRVVDRDLMTLADIADRVRLSRESVRRYSVNERGGGGFPPPVNPGRKGSVFYRWSEVAPWLREHVQSDLPDFDQALVFANLVVQARRLRPQVRDVHALEELLAV